MTPTLVILDGTVIDVDQAQISVTDDGLLRGDGVFEVARIYGGRPFALDEHLERMARSAATLRLPFDTDAVRADATALLAAGEPDDAMLRLVVTRGGRRIGMLETLPERPETISLATITYTPTRVLDGVKSLSYAANMLATRLAREQGADEALLVSPHGRVLEGPDDIAVLRARRRAPHPAAERSHPGLDHPPRAADRHRRRRAHHHAGRSRGGERGVPGFVAARGAPRARDRRRRARARARPGLVRCGRGRARAHRGRARARTGRVRIVTVIGNRPQFVKAAAVSGPLREQHEELLVHTGQHYDDELSAIFVRELDMPAPDVELGLGGGSNTEQTARMLAALGELLHDEQPDAVLVYGDTNSTLAGALAAAQARIPVAHVEAGMRSFDRAMPEELNRVVTDHVSDLLLVPSQNAADNLAREGIADAAVHVVGDVMVDVARLLAPRARADDGAAAGRRGAAR